MQYKNHLQGASIEFEAVMDFIDSRLPRDNDDWNEGLVVHELLVALRDRLNDPALVMFHVCQHEEGVGNCRPVVLVS